MGRLKGTLDHLYHSRRRRVSCLLFFSSSVRAFLIYLLPLLFLSFRLFSARFFRTRILMRVFRVGPEPPSPEPVSQSGLGHFFRRNGRNLSTWSALITPATRESELRFGKLFRRPRLYVLSTL